MLTILAWWVLYVTALALWIGGETVFRFLLRVAVFGLLGLLIEDVFTGVWSLVVKGDGALTSTTYLCMLPVYGFSGVLLEALNFPDRSFWQRLKRAFIFDVPCIFVVEYIYGWVLRLVIGRCPWDYTGARWSVSGLVRLDYGFYWLALAMCIPPLSRLVRHVIRKG